MGIDRFKRIGVALFVFLSLSGLLFLLARRPALADEPAGRIYFPVAAARFPLQQRQGDWVVAGHEIVGQVAIQLEGNLIVPRGASLTLRGAHLTLNAAYPAQYGIRVEAGGALTIEAGAVITRGRSAATYAFEVEAGSQFSMRDSELGGCGVGVPYAWGLDEPVGLKVGASDAVFERNRFAGNFNAIILLPESERAVIRDNRFLLGNGWGGVMAFRSRGATIAGNDFRDGLFAIQLEGSDQNVIAGNTFVNSGEGAIWLFYGWDNDIRDNLITDSHWCGIELDMPSGNNRVVNNRLTGVDNIGANGINLHHAVNNLIQDNVISNIHQGMEISYARNNIIAGNVFTLGVANTPSFGGLILYHSSENQLVNNQVRLTAQGNGLLMFGRTMSNTLRGNVISSTFRGALLQTDADGNVFTENGFAAGEDRAIVVTKSSRNLFTRNNFYAGGRPAHDDGANAWDAGGQGNYWSDRAGSGPQPVGPNGVDHFPLATPVALTPAPTPAFTPMDRVSRGGAPTWIVAEPLVFANTVITVEDSLFIEAGGSLTLINARMSMLSGPNMGGIRIKPGAGFYVYSSVIAPVETGGGYGLSAQAGSALVIKDSEVRGAGFSWGTDWGGLYLMTDQVIIENSLLADHFRGPVFIPPASAGVRILNNRIVGGERGLWLNALTDTIVSGNRIEDVWGSAVTLNGGAGVNLSHNVIVNDWWGSGFGISGEGHAIISNTVQGMWTGAAVNVSGAGHLIAGNVVTNAGETAFALSGDGLIVRENAATDASEGFSLYDLRQSVITGNRLEDLRGTAFGLQGATLSNTFTCNRLNGAGVGLYLGDQTAGNRWRHNIFSDTLNPGWDVGNNQWDWAGRGNYWSKYAGPDGNGDGTGDEVYRIPPNGIDHAPLMAPWAGVCPP